MRQFFPFLCHFSVFMSIYSTNPALVPASPFAGLVLPSHLLMSRSCLLLFTFQSALSLLIQNHQCSARAISLLLLILAFLQWLVWSHLSSRFCACHNLPLLISCHYRSTFSLCMCLYMCSLCFPGVSCPDLLMSPSSLPINSEQALLVLTLQYLRACSLLAVTAWTRQLSYPDIVFVFTVDT